jgi:hypothetical protein
LDRDEGFYWVSLSNGDLEVAQWDSERWWLCGNNRPFEEWQVRVRSEMLDPP